VDKPVRGPGKIFSVISEDYLPWPAVLLTTSPFEIFYRFCAITFLPLLHCNYLTKIKTNMKKILYAASAGLLCFCISCNSKDSGGKMSDKAQKNLDAAHIVSNAFMSGDVSKIDSAVASNFVDHTDKGDKNRDSLKAMITMMHAKPSDMKMELTKELADDDYVMSWMRFTGTSDGSMGMPKGPYDFTGIEVEKYKDGMAVEHWEFSNLGEMMKMMPPPNNNNMDNKMGEDTTKKKM
jgi:predicted SnoaL-like aldol condensation-catalyzing enzyme